MNLDLVLADTRRTLPRLRVPPMAVATAALFALLLLLLLMSRDPGLTQLQIRGTMQRVQPADVRAAVEPYLEQAFFSVELDELRRAVLQIPWVSQARVERVWPGAIAVRIWEREPYARWNEDQLLDTRVQVFTPRPAEIPVGLPKLSGHRGSEREVAETFGRLSAVLANTPLMLSGLSLDARGEWTARTLTDIELRLGQGVPDEHLPMLLGSASRTLGARWADVKYLDLRYTNGFSVGWHEPTETGVKK
jgi:cell division protein FtsQ